jgi:hypothetical protein
VIFQGGARSARIVWREVRFPMPKHFDFGLSLLRTGQVTFGKREKLVSAPFEVLLNPCG